MNENEDFGVKWEICDENQDTYSNIDVDINDMEKVKEENSSGSNTLILKWQSEKENNIEDVASYKMEVDKIDDEENIIPTGVRSSTSKHIKKTTNRNRSLQSGSNFSNDKNENIKANKKVGTYSREERILLYNIYLYFNDKLGISTSQSILETSKATGVSFRTLYKIRNEIKEGKDLDLKKLRKSKYKNSRIVKYSENVINKIKRIVKELGTKEEPFDIQIILKLINQDNSLPNFKRSTLINFFNDIGIIFKRTHGCKGIYIVKE